MSQLEKLSFIVKGKIVPKERPRLGRGRIYTPASTVDYEQLIGIEARQAMIKSGQKIFSYQVIAIIEIRLPIPVTWAKEKKEKALKGDLLPFSNYPDVDNVVKSVLDGLNHVAFHDDKQVCDLMAYKRYSKEEHLKITLWGKID